MKKLSVILSFLVAYANLMAQPAVPALKISHLTGGFYIYTTYQNLNGKPFPSNSMYLITSDGAVLFDTPWDSTQFQPLLDSIFVKHGKKAVLCISTHFHADRTAGLEFFKGKGIPTYSSELTYRLCREKNQKQAAFYFTRDTVFSVGRQKIETYYPGEGHSPDNIVIWIPKEKILYGGCLVKSTENVDIGNLSDANLDAWPRSIENVLKKYPGRQFVIPGHFGWDDDHGLEHTLDLLKKHSGQ